MKEVSILKWPKGMSSIITTKCGGIGVSVRLETVYAAGLL